MEYGRYHHQHEREACLWALDAEAIAHELLETYVSYAHHAWSIGDFKVTGDQPTPVLIATNDMVNRHAVDTLANLFASCGAWPTWIAPALVAQDDHGQTWALTGNLPIQAAYMANVSYRIVDVSEAIKELKSKGFSWADIAYVDAATLAERFQSIGRETLEKIADLEDEINHSLIYWRTKLEDDYGVEF
jgi:hypothetical protein